MSYQIFLGLKKSLYELNPFANEPSNFGKTILADSQDTPADLNVLPTEFKSTKPFDQDMDNIGVEEEVGNIVLSGNLFNSECLGFRNTH